MLIMKKKIALLLSFVLLTGLFTGCGKGDNAKDVSKYVTLGEYKGVQVTIEEENLDRPVEVGDTVNIDYVGKKDDVAFEGGTAQGYDLGIGSGSFIDGFEDGLVGVMPGETVDLNLTFPEQYHSEELAGAEVVFTVTVNYIVSDAPKAEDLVFEAVMNGAVFAEIPKEYIEKYTEIINANAANYASAYGVDVATMTMYMYGADAATVADAFAKQELVMQAIANAEGLNISDKELEETLKADAEAAGYSVDEFLNGASKEDYRDSLMMDNAYNFIIDNAVVTYEQTEE